MPDSLRSCDDLNPGDVVVFAPGDARTVHHSELTPTQRYASVTWADGRTSLCDRWRTWTRLASGPDPRARTRPSAPTPPPPPPTQEDTP